MDFEASFINAHVANMASRYQVQDLEPSNGVAGLIYTKAAEDLDPIPEVGEEMVQYAVGMRVFARYPETRSFYHATVRSPLQSGYYILGFEGVDKSTVKVDARFVIRLFWPINESVEWETSGWFREQYLMQNPTSPRTSADNVFKSSQHQSLSVQHEILVHAFLQKVKEIQRRRYVFTTDYQEHGSLTTNLSVEQVWSSESQLLTDLPLVLFDAFSDEIISTTDKQGHGSLMTDFNMEQVWSSDSELIDHPDFVLFNAHSDEIISSTDNQGHGSLTTDLMQAESRIPQLLDHSPSVPSDEIMYTTDNPWHSSLTTNLNMEQGCSSSSQLLDYSYTNSNSARPD